MNVANLISGSSPFLNLVCTSVSSQFTYCIWLEPSSRDFEHFLASMWNELNCTQFKHSLALSLLGLKWKCVTTLALVKQREWFHKRVYFSQNITLMAKGEEIRGEIKTFSGDWRNCLLSSGIGLDYICFCFTAGSQHGRSHPWQGHAERLDGQAESGLRGSPWIFLNIYPQKPESACFTVLCFPPTRLTLTGGCPPTTFFWKKLISSF